MVGVGSEGRVRLGGGGQGFGGQGVLREGDGGVTTMKRTLVVLARRGWGRHEVMLVVGRLYLGRLGESGLRDSG